MATSLLAGCSLGRGAADAPPGPGEPAARTPASSSAPGSEPPAPYPVTGEQVREWAFLGWCALIDADKYLRAGSLWETHSQLHEARQHIWALWAAAHGALYPWHGLSQVLDHDPGNLPPGIEHTVACLNAADLRSAARASVGVLATASQPPPGGTPPTFPRRRPPTSPARSPANPDRRPVSLPA